VRSCITKFLECFKTVKYNWFIKISTNTTLLTFITIRLQRRWYECYNKNILYFSSLWLRLLFVRLIPNESLYALNSAAYYVEMAVCPAVTIKVMAFSHVTSCSCVYKYYFRKISCSCFLKIKAAGPSELLAPITQQHDVTSYKINPKSVVLCTDLQWNRGVQLSIYVSLCETVFHYAEQRWSTESRNWQERRIWWHIMHMLPSIYPSSHK